MLYNNKVYLYLRSEDIHNEKYTLDEGLHSRYDSVSERKYNRVADEFESFFGEKPTAFFSAQAELR